MNGNSTIRERVAEFGLEESEMMRFRNGNSDELRTRWREWRAWFERHAIISRASAWLRENPPPHKFDGSKWKFAWLNMPIKEMGFSADEARRAFSDHPLNPTFIPA